MILKSLSEANLNSKGAASVFIVMSILAAVLAVALGSASIITNERKMSMGSSESVVAYYAAETGIEKAIYNIVKDKEEPIAVHCSIVSPAVDCDCPASSSNWTVFGGAFYCLKITETTADDYTTITAIKSIGEYKTTRRSIEVSF